MTFDTFFQTATGNPPYDYQRRLAGSDEGRDCKSLLIDIPTGLGKTAAVVLAWLWNRVGHPDRAHRDTWPRRLVICLPMRTLVEQTRDNVRLWLRNLGDLEWPPESDHAGKVGLHLLMGGEEAGEWDLHPEADAILIGTQDMLLSRALNRGYAMSRYRWPMHFGLLNNDCLWVMDETQLMGVGVETSAQLDGFRHDSKMSTMGVCPTWWMSATLEDARLATVDHQKPEGGWPKEKLSKEEETVGRPKELITAKKKLSPTELILNSSTKGSYSIQLAKFIQERHQSGTLTLVVVNRVLRAREIYEALVVGKNPLYAPDRVALIHSRFRPTDRKHHARLLFEDGDRIVIATQAVEVGVDISARLLITEIAPWSSLVQRIGRCNRYSRISDAEVLWVDIEPKDEKDDLSLPYQKAELDRARAALAQLTDASPQTLRSVIVAEERVIRPVIRRRDLIDLFDTTPDLCGQDLDISRYIRDGIDNDVQYFWRDIQDDTPAVDVPAPQPNELCRVSIGDAIKFFSKKPRAWRWNPLDERWESATYARPGSVYLIDAKAGGYDDKLGWTGNPKNKPTPYPPVDGAQEAYSSDPLASLHQWQTLTEHTALVVRETQSLAMQLAKEYGNVLHSAALWHDIGKAHVEFQAMLRNGDATREGTLWAKAGSQGSKCRRPGFRHELASALAWLLAGPPDSMERDLVAYLIAAHHGKVRLSIRSLPNETAPEGEDRLFARGIWHGDMIPAVSLGEITTPEATLDLSFMQMGEGLHGPSWLARAIAVRDRIGPFRLAFLETLLRAADARASRQTPAD